MTIRRGTPADVPRALAIWRAGVDADYGFLGAEHRATIDAMVATEFLPNAPLWLSLDAASAAQGFLVMDGGMIDALFVDPAAQGQGHGSALVGHALTLAPDAVVDASEQAPRAIAFYEARGFVRFGRSEVDGLGMPYPLIHLRYRPGG